MVQVLNVAALLNAKMGMDSHLKLLANLSASG
jgi:hypothetical protein